MERDEIGKPLSGSWKQRRLSGLFFITGIGKGYKGFYRFPIKAELEFNGLRLAGIKHLFNRLRLYFVNGKEKTGSLKNLLTR